MFVVGSVRKIMSGSIFVTFPIFSEYMVRILSTLVLAEESGSTNMITVNFTISITEPLSAVTLLLVSNSSVMNAK
jgi:hypothetical protein